MTDDRTRGYGPIYPAFCHSASPTYWKWIKLTAADVHALRTETGFEGQNVYFHLNHPIQHVYLVGTLVAVDFSAQFVLLTLDDSSGQTIELKTKLVLPPKKQIQALLRDVEQTDSLISGDGHAGHSNLATNGSLSDLSAPEANHTEIENVTVTKSCHDARCFAKHVLIDGQLAEVGTVITAKGTLEKFRGVFQLRLLRTLIIEDTEDELRIWTEYAEFCYTVLVRPWKLTPDDVQDLERKDRERTQNQKKVLAKEAQLRKEIEQKRIAKRDLWRAKMQRDEDRMERRRAREEREMDGNALDGPIQPHNEHEKAAGGHKQPSR